jgi:hypothetical protein
MSISGMPHILNRQETPANESGGTVKLSIVIPVYNEKDTIDVIIRRVKGNAIRERISSLSSIVRLTALGDISKKSSTNRL